MLKVRSSFYCDLCDFETHRYIDVIKKEVTINLHSCGDIARNTIDYSYFLNV